MPIGLWLNWLVYNLNVCYLIVFNFDLSQCQGRRLGLCIRAAQVSSNDFKTGMSIEVDGQPFKVVGTCNDIIMNLPSNVVPICNLALVAQVQLGELFSFRHLWFRGHLDMCKVITMPSYIMQNSFT